MSSILGWTVVSFSESGDYRIVSGEHLSGQKSASDLALLLNRRAQGGVAYQTIPVTLGYAPKPLGFEVIRPIGEGLWTAETGIHPTLASGLAATKVLRSLIREPRLAALVPIEDLFR